jgi:hypothetical protein
MQSASLVLPPEPGLEGRLTGNGMVFVSPTYGLDDELRVCLGETDSAPLCRSASPHPSLGLHSLSMMAVLVLHHFDYFFSFTLENHDAAEGPHAQIAHLAAQPTSKPSPRHHFVLS